MSPKDAASRTVELLESVGTPLPAERARAFPHQLSSGLRQRATIAMALAADPELIIADEPTRNLDSRTSVEIMGIFQQLNERGITIIMVTHEQDIAAYARRNVVMRDGLILNDFNVTQRLDAATELQKIPPIDSQAQL